MEGPNPTLDLRHDSLDLLASGNFSSFVYSSYWQEVSLLSLNLHCEHLAMSIRLTRQQTFKSRKSM